MNSIKTIGKSFFLGLSILFFMSDLHSQSYKNLTHLKGGNIETYYSEGALEQAEAMAFLCENVLSFYKTIIDFEPTVTLLVLSPTDWSAYTHFPVYGMPHYPNAKTLVVASQDNDFWKSMLPPLDNLPTDLGNQISETYVDYNGKITMRAFFNLLAIHELGHAYHEQGGLSMQRKWLGELFCNMFLHTFIAENRPELLPALTIFPNMVVSSTSRESLKYSTLNDFEANYGLIASQHPQNYGWYQCRLHTAAGNIYDEAGITAFSNLWNTLKANKDPIDDAALAELLTTQVHESVAHVQMHWND
ncbi:hypothetical protein [Constantimarinum furrinae]|uniref:Uncharacterized protein n=1 Tax=Constantimarinum furrinae TaxID=2562285 RepID=A0A7G8PW47_9FLAO|nr:hypothetical protein [Constantimarinum furrinae]QNJ98563.1 hypothetical protein ALE3EI_2016 [Constantimarinum furrinae]